MDPIPVKVEDLPEYDTYLEARNFAAKCRRRCEEIDMKRRNKLTGLASKSDIELQANIVYFQTEQEVLDARTTQSLAMLLWNEANIALLTKHHELVHSDETQAALASADCSLARAQKLFLKRSEMQKAAAREPRPPKEQLEELQVTLDKKISDASTTARKQKGALPLSEAQNKGNVDLKARKREADKPNAAKISKIEQEAAKPKQKVVRKTSTTTQRKGIAQKSKAKPAVTLPENKVAPVQAQTAQSKRQLRPQDGASKVPKFLNNAALAGLFSDSSEDE